jgi:hypothetical protein
MWFGAAKRRMLKTENHTWDTRNEDSLENSILGVRVDHPQVVHMHIS